MGEDAHDMGVLWFTPSRAIYGPFLRRHEWVFCRHEVLFSSVRGPFVGAMAIDHFMTLNFMRYHWQGPLVPYEGALLAACDLRYHGINGRLVAWVRATIQAL